MEQTILIYNNRTGIAEKIEPFLTGDSFRVLVTENVEQLKLLLTKHSYRE